MQVAKGATMNTFDAFTPVEVATVPAHSNIYFGHMYVVPGGTAILAVMPIAWGAPDEHHSGIYVSISRDGKRHWSRLEVFHPATVLLSLRRFLASSVFKLE